MAAQYEGWEWFYLDDEAENVGPFTTEELRSFYSEGGITDQTYGTFAHFKRKRKKMKIFLHSLFVSLPTIHSLSSVVVVCCLI
jgi:hypothetical protein